MTFAVEPAGRYLTYIGAFAVFGMVGPLELLFWFGPLPLPIKVLLATAVLSG